MTPLPWRATRDVSPLKIGVPDAVGRAVVRDRLMSAIDDQAHLVVIRAPAGYGKTTLVAQWAATRLAVGEVVAWATLDQFDDDIYSLWSVILAALEVSGAPATEQLAELIPPRDETQAGFLAALAVALAAQSQPISLVIDDLQETGSREVQTSLEFFARHLPPGLRLVLITRTLPAMALERLSLTESYTYIDVSALRFSFDETRTLLALHGLELERTAVDSVVGVTEGWAAGLRFAVSSIGSADHAADAIARISASDHSTNAYLAQEVFERHPVDAREFLLATSICDHVSVELAGVLTGRADAGPVLAGLEDDNMLISRVESDPICYRYHALLREFLRIRLRERGVDQWRSLHAAASGWFEARGDDLSALAHAVAADDLQSAECIMTRSAFAFVARGDGAALRRVLEDVPAEWLTNPQVGLLAAAAHLDAGDLTAADAVLESISIDDASSDAALDATVRLHRARLGGDMASALERAVAVGAGYTGDEHLDLQSLIHIGVAQMYLGDHDDARQPLGIALELSRSQGGDYVTVQCLLHMSVLAGMRGDLRSMAAYGRHAVDIGRRHGWDHTSVCSFAHIAIGWAAFLWLDNSTATACAAAGVDSLRTRSDPTVHGAAEAFHAVVAFADADDRLSVVTRLRSTWDLLGDEVIAPALWAYVSPYEARMCFRVDHPEWVVELADRMERRFGPIGEAWLVRAMVALHRHDHLQAGVELDRIAEQPSSCLVATSLVEASLLQAELSLAMGAAEPATAEHIVRALHAARAQSLFRPFVAASAAVRTQTARILEDPAAPSDHRLLRAIRASLPANEFTLTKRELELVRELRWRREVRVELTINEIAAELYMSRNTAKSHLRSLYRKLGVTNRAEAVEAAERLGLG